MTESATDQTEVPRHIAIIMDGNGRWARQRKQPRTFGHKKGVEATRRAIEFFAKSGVRHLTLFAFSSENWNRPQAEVSTLMSLFVSSLKRNTTELDKNGICIRFIGDRGRFEPRLVQQIEESEQQTRDNQLMTLNVAANYGGQWDIAQAARALAHKVARGELAADEVDAAQLAGRLSLADTPDPDLFIRTGGETRISNFLLWQLAYSELYFTDVLWPDFAADEMRAALNAYSRRQRRFGRTGEQVQVAG